MSEFKKPQSEMGKPQTWVQDEGRLFQEVEEFHESAAYSVSLKVCRVYGLGFRASGFKALGL